MDVGRQKNTVCDDEISMSQILVLRRVSRIYIARVSC